MVYTSSHGRQTTFAMAILSVGFQGFEDETPRRRGRLPSARWTSPSRPCVRLHWWTHPRTSERLENNFAKSLIRADFHYPGDETHRRRRISQLYLSQLCTYVLPCLQKQSSGLISAQRRLSKIVNFGWIFMTSETKPTAVNADLVPPSRNFACMFPNADVHVLRPDDSPRGTLAKCGGFHGPLPPRMNVPSTSTSRTASVPLATSSPHSTQSIEAFQGLSSFLPRSFEIRGFGWDPLPRGEIACQRTEFWTFRHATLHGYSHIV